MKLIALILFSLPLNLICQELILEKLPLIEVFKMEETLQSENVGNHWYKITDDYITENKIVLKKTCVRFKRSSDTFSPKLHTWYFIDNDSIVRVAKYYWGYYNKSVHPDTLNIIAKSEFKKSDKWNNHYNRLKKTISSQVGSRGKEIKKRKFDAYDYIQNVWLEEDYKITLTEKFVHSEGWSFDTYVSIEVMLK